MNNEESLDKYLADLSFDKDPLTGEIALLTTQHNRFHPGRSGGLLMAILASTTRMEHVFEWTAAYGSTTLWLAKALPEKARHTIGVVSDENLRLISNYMKRAGLSARVQISKSSGPDHLLSLESPQDLIVLDLQQERTKLGDWYAAIEKKLAPGGILVSLGMTPPEGNGARSLLHSSIESFNHKILGNPNFLTTIIPVSQGMLVASRLP
ncbi:MAG: class I SAM-dependent methyltransferase [Nitrospirae bacterium]|jgi:predicted O-methyltransferase YrrM|uniref:O-methyltransferase-like protein n=1 Tax=Leptospirillum ferrodiazotrophum TaxID=412449 RepID=C6HXW4_9BACT|nr:MAG: O-methyltransferase-like protein [Leptospirillum ferrodiazotrophum]MCL5954267.1 class I SAM-dependent methyltransferase [Nitrospirota bacterium]